MIQAWFNLAGGVRVPARVPGPELVEMAKAIGLSETDLFSVDIPSGATRWARIKVLVAQSQLSTLYANKPVDGRPGGTFSWRSNSADSPHLMPVTFLPPKPLCMIAGGEGVAIVEAVDARWWARQFNLTNVATPWLGPMFGSDGRWFSTGLVTSTTPRNLVLALQSNLASVFPFTVPAGYDPPQVLLNRIADMGFSPQTSTVMLLDMILAATGWVLQWDPTADIYTLKEVGGDIELLSTWMNANRVAVAGGVSPTASFAVPVDPLDALWQSIANAQINQFPDQVLITHPYRTVEGMTEYDNFRATLAISPQMSFPLRKDNGYLVTITNGTQRDRPTGAARIVSESRAINSTSTPGVDVNNPTVWGNNGTTPPAWPFVSLGSEITALLRKRLTVAFGKVAWAGWRMMPLGSYRGTMLRYTLAMLHGEVVPLTITQADEDEWLLGPDGMQPCDPEDVIFSKGLIGARKLGNGAVQIDAAPPSHRVFAAKITGNTQVTDQWRWTYTWTEVEKDLAGTTPASTSPLSRTNVKCGTAVNMAEYGNTYGVRVAPGVIVADYAPNTVIPQPICNDTIVMMCETFPSLYPGADGYAVPAYCWFSMPNAVKVTCVTPPQLIVEI